MTFCIKAVRMGKEKQFEATEIKCVFEHTQTMVKVQCPQEIEETTFKKQSKCVRNYHVIVSSMNFEFELEIRESNHHFFILTKLQCLYV